MTNILQDYSSDPAIQIHVSSNQFAHDDPIPPSPVATSQPVVLIFKLTNTGYGVCIYLATPSTKQD